MVYRMRSGGVLSILWVLAAASGCAGELGPPDTGAPAEAEAAGAVLEGPECSWSQWGQSAAHDGQTCVRGQAPIRELDHIVYDPFEFQEMSETFGELLVTTRSRSTTAPVTSS
jgi:hypothetical protein